MRTEVLVPREKLLDEVPVVARQLYRWLGGRGSFQVHPGQGSPGGSSSHAALRQHRSQVRASNKWLGLMHSNWKAESKR